MSELTIHRAGGCCQGQSLALAVHTLTWRVLGLVTCRGPAALLCEKGGELSLQLLRSFSYCFIEAVVSC